MRRSDHGVQSSEVHTDGQAIVVMLFPALVIGYTGYLKVNLMVYQVSSVYPLRSGRQAHY